MSMFSVCMITAQDLLSPKVIYFPTVCSSTRCAVSLHVVDDFTY